MNGLGIAGLRLATVSAAVAVSVATVRADGSTDEVSALRAPDSRVEIGGGHVDSDNGNFGKYTGLNEQGEYLLLDADINRREDDSGSWLRLRVRNAGLDSREIRIEQERQGSWSYYLEYNEIPRFEPLTVTTGVVGIGGPNLSTAGAASEVEFESKRKRLDLGLTLNSLASSKWGFSFDFRNEEKKGERIFGVGTPGGNRFNFTPEPLDSTISLIEGTFRYTDRKFQFAGGYYGTMFRNDPKALTWDYGDANLLALSPLALPPDNESHQVHVSGGYSFSPAVRGTFKAAYTLATQDDTFILPSVSGRTDLGGRIETTLLQAGISARPMPNLSITGNLRYEDRDDRTPVVQYIVPAGANNTWDGFNEPRDIETTHGKLEASYGLPGGVRAIGEVQYEKKERNTFTYRSVSHRDTTEEMTYTAALRRTMSDTLTGGISYAHADRFGSDFRQNILFNSNAAGSNVFAPLHYADRQRDKVRVSLNWFPTDPLSLQVYVDEISDRYDGDRDGSGGGPRRGEQRVFALDAGYRFSENWQGSLWYNRNEYRWENAIPGVAYDTSSNEGDSYGAGLRGRLHARLEAGVDLSYSEVEDRWNQESLSGVPVPSQLPVATTRQARLNLFGNYTLEENSGIRFDYIYDQYSTDDVTWGGWGPGGTGSYSDGTVIREPSPQKLHFVGVQYFHRFQ